MNDSNSETRLTGFDLWTPNDYSNFITISAAAIGSTLLVIFKSRCKNIKLCFGLLECIREVKSDSEEENEEQENNNNNNNQQPPPLPERLLPANQDPPNP